MDKYGKIISPDTIRFERVLPGPITRVWDYITDSEKRGKWLASGDMQLFAGGQYTLHFKHSELSPAQETPPEKYKDMVNGHSFTGTVLQCEPPYLLVFTWVDGSEVTIELAEQQEDNRILLVLTHRKLSPKKTTRISIASGWHTHLHILSDVLDGTVPKGFWEVHNRMENTYAAKLFQDATR